MTPTSPTKQTATPVTGPLPAQGLAVPPGGFTFDAGYPLTFPPGPISDLAAMFPTIMPEVERAVWERVNESCSSRQIFPFSGQGMGLPAAFSIPADVGLYAGMSPGYPNPLANAALPPGAPPQPPDVPPIPVVRGWPAYPGTTPGIGVAEMNTSPDTSEQAAQAGFAGDVFAVDSLGNIIATAAYYAEPMLVVVVVELIHLNRDERDRLHDQLYRVIYPLRHILPGATSQIREVEVSSEKQELPIPEQPDTVYVSLFTVQVHCEALIPTEITPDGVIEQIQTTVTPLPTPRPTDPYAFTDLT